MTPSAPSVGTAPVGRNNSLNLESFHILRSLGEGGMGSVFLAFEPAAQRQVALKVLADKLAKDRIHVDRFYREARIGASLDHPNIVHTFAYGKDPATGRHAMVLEYVDGPSCQYLLDRDGHLQLDDAVLIIYHIAKALAELRDRKIVHRDVKPDNILLTSGGIAKLADFGLAKQLGGPDDLTAHQAAFGSSWYMPFEQAKNAGFVDERSDIFSLGATFYHLLTGQVPFPGESHAEVVAMKQSDRYVPVSQVNPQLPPALDPIIARMLALDPRRRYPSARELIIDIEKSRLLNAYRVGTVLPEGGAKSEKERLDIAATSPDLNLNTDSKDAPAHGELPWHLRYQDRAGRTYTRKATTKQVLEGLRAGRWPLGVEAARSERRRFRPLREYPEFQQYLDTPLEGGDLMNQTAPLPEQKPKRRLRKIWIGIGFVFGLAVAATVASLMRGLLWLAPCDCHDSSLFCQIIQSLRSIW